MKFVDGKGCKCDENQKTGKEADSELELNLIVLADTDFLFNFKAQYIIDERR